MNLLKLTFKNIMSYGNNYNIITFNSNNINEIIGIIGRNGFGKTSILDCIFFVLYNKPYRNKSTKKDLINRTNKKGLYVKIEFISKGDEYVIERGMSPNIINICKNGIDEDLDAHSNDIQKFIETQIIGINENIFRMIFMMGLGTFKSFFEQSISDRRDMFEFMVGMNVLSIMMKKIKKYNNQLENKIDVVKNKFNESKKLKSVYEQKLQDISKIKQNKDIESNIEVLENTIKNIEIEMSKIDIDSLSSEIKSIQKQVIEIENNRDNDKSSFSKNSLLIKQDSKTLNFFNNNDNCPTCMQEIDSKFKNDEISKLKKIINKLQAENTLLSKNMKRDNDSINERNINIDKIKDEKYFYKKQQQKIENKNEDLASLKNLRNKGDEDYKKILLELEEKIEGVKIDIKKYADSGRVIQKKIKINNMFIDTLSDNGIKKYIYSLLLGKINININHYLSEFSSNIKIQIKNDLSIIFYYRIGENIKYSSFSNGEKMVINLSFTFGILDFIEDFYGFSSNFLFFDEILDASLDDINRNFLLENLKKINKNIIIISHDNNLASAFTKSYFINKNELGFSNIMEQNYEENTREL